MFKKKGKNKEKECMWLRVRERLDEWCLMSVRRLVSNL